jgi:release factor glutamine methyltransferase
MTLDTVGGLVQWAAQELRKAGLASARLEAQLLLGHVLGGSRTDLLAHPERAISASKQRAFRALVARRMAAEPLAYILGTREFYGREFKVDRRALIPRPETELLVDIGKAAVARWRAMGVTQPTVVDVGAGSGSISVSLGLECQLAVVATDVSSGALSLARANAQRLGAGRLVNLVQTDLLAGLRGPLHVVLANLPYVPSTRHLPPDVRDYEPPLALFGGPRGTELIERLFREAAPLLADGAELAVELDEQEQATSMAALAQQLYPRADVTICRDAGGYDRVVRVLLP